MFILIQINNVTIFLCAVLICVWNNLISSFILHSIMLDNFQDDDGNDNDDDDDGDDVLLPIF